MFELQGKYASAKIFTDLADQNSISQVYNLLNQPYMEGSKVRMMPDIHAGAGCTVGTTITISDKVCPNLVGVDIGCGMEVAVLKETRFEPQQLDKVIRERIPSGFDVRKTVHRYIRDVPLESLRCFRKIKLEKARNSLGTLGGGNHFIEVDVDDEGSLYVVIHSGSRHLGLEVANYYQKEAYKQLQELDEPTLRAKKAEIKDQYKKEGRTRELEEAFREVNKGIETTIPYPLAYCSGYLFDDYLHDMEIVQHYAMLSRKAMMDEIVKGMGFHIVDQFTTIHNYIDTKAMILRKGAISAQKGERVIIPLNMRDGSLICVGKGNEDWNYSAPHGAGRLLSRSDAKNSFSVKEFREAMKGIYSTSVGASTIDESPMAYKPIEAIIDNIGDTVDITNRIKPIYNFKAGDEE